MAVDERELAAVLRKAERALAEGQRNVAGTDDPEAEPHSTWAEPLRDVRFLMAKNGIECDRS